MKRISKFSSHKADLAARCANKGQPFPRFWGYTPEAEISKFLCFGQVARAFAEDLSDGLWTYGHSLPIFVAQIVLLGACAPFGRHDKATDRVG
jgi:hypothetical protein